MLKNGTINWKIRCCGFKKSTDKYGGNDNIWAIPYLELATIYVRGKAKVDGIIRAITIISENIIDLFETGV